MSNSSYGKIILFRTEDLIAAISGQFLSKAGAVSDSYFPFGVATTFQDSSGATFDPLSAPGSQSGTSTGKLEPKLPFNAEQSQENIIYRMLSRNYKLSSDDLQSVKYNEFSLKSGDSLVNFLVDYENVGTENEIKFKLIRPENSAIAAAEGFTQTIYDGVPYSPRFQPSNFKFFNHNISVSRPLTTGKSLTPEEILVVASDNFGGYDIFTSEFKENLEKYGAGDTLKIIPVYNYYLEEYEKFYNDIPVTTSNLPHEKAIPNFYYLLSLISDKETYASVTPGVPSPSNIYSSNFRPFQINLILKSLASTRFLNSQSTSLVSPIGVFLPDETITKELDFLIERNSVVVVTSEFYKSFASLIEEQKKLHPFYNEIQIPVQKGGTVFRDLFKKAKFYDQLQYRAGLQIKLVNQYLYLGGNANNLLTSYDIFYNKIIPPGNLSNIGAAGKIVFTNSKLPIQNNNTTFVQQTIPYQTFGQNFSTGIVEFNIAPTPETAGENIDYKNEEFGFWLGFKNVSTIGNVSMQQYKLSSFLKISNFYTTPEYFNSIYGDEQELTAEQEKLTTQITNPLVFYADTNGSENDYISSVLQSQAKQILEIILNKAKLDVFSVFDNKKNYSEILFFEIQKIDSETNELIQTFILPNDPDVGDFVNYVDTQIKYGKGYIYKFYAHTISIGNGLQRLDAKSVEETNDFIPPELLTDGNTVASEAEKTKFKGTEVNFEYDNSIDIKLIRVPYQNAEGVLYEDENPTITYNVDSPPLPPNVQFFPFKNISDKIGFWFNLGLGEFEALPIRALNAESEDAELSKYIIENLNLSEGSKIKFKTDDFGGKIQVYRITNRPKTYSEFKENKIADIDIDGARTLIDDIIPNQDYYYVFRHVDVHGLPSNPSPVYHFKMISTDSVKEAGSVRVGVDGLEPVLFNELIYLSDENNIKIKEKTFKKYLLVERSLNQSYLSFDNFETGGPGQIGTALDIKTSQGDLSVGTSKENFVSVDGKKFKIRVTSKQTGRKIDLNVDFKNLSVIENYD